ncbi:MAG: hypothetical protein OHK93_005315 [Ramalina farinacea]|uniref:Uncharacterized protein n=1 Tax=Ramalina farinacea TaxID=258253 RepID=A0AA43QVW1_9LECA|nr:hypothetical protein [Ramalina farinacea]
MAHAQASHAQLSSTHHTPSSSESKTMKTTIAKSTNLLDCPLEIRIMIYTHYFSSGPSHIEVEPQGDWGSYEVRIRVIYGPNGSFESKSDPMRRIFRHQGSFKSKQGLLGTNKSVRAEALPIFRQYHTFLVGRRPNATDLGISNTTHGLASSSVGRAITRMDFRRPFFPSELGTRQFPSIVQQLLDHCPQLRFLKFRWALLRTPGQGADTDSQLSPGSEGAGLLRQLCRRLVRLEIILFHFAWCDFQESQGVAPANYWTLDWRGQPPQWYKIMPTKIRSWTLQSRWSLDCARLGAGDVGWSGVVLK